MAITDNPNAQKERICILHAKCSEELKTQFNAKCESAGINPSSILRKLAKAYVDGDIKFEV